mgnify:CR=1 FL=1
MTLQITTRKADEVMTAYVDHFQHGISCAEVIGGYSREKMYLLHAVVSTYESQDIIKLVCDIDPGAVINVFVGASAGMMAISVAAIGIFSAYMLYDLKQILDGGETNYISATLALYLDLFNVFQSLLALLGIMGGERD